MNRKLLLLLWAILLIPIACRQDEPITNNEDTTKLAYFQVFGEKDRPNINYADGFRKLFERYDSINISQKKNKQLISGKFSTTKLQKNTSYYIDFRFHSQPIRMDNEDVAVLYPVMENGNIISVAAVFLTDNRTQIQIKTLNKKTEFYIRVFQKFSNAINKERKGKESRYYCEVCYEGSIEEVIIGKPRDLKMDLDSITGGGGGNSFPEPIGLYCGDFNDCFSGGLPIDGGGFPIDDWTEDSNDPCEKAKESSSVATTNSTTEAYKDAKKTITEKNDGKEHGVVFGNVNGQIKSTDIQTGTAENGTLSHSFSDPVADLHNHPDNKPPSSGDVYSLIKARTQYPNYNTRYVVTQDGTTYALVITDFTAMNEFYRKYPPSQIAGYSPDFPGQIFEDWYNFTFDGFGNSEMALSHILEKYNIGIALTKMDNTGNLKKINVKKNTSNGNTTYTQSNCN